MTEELYLLTLLATPRIGPQAVRFLQSYCPDPPVSLRDLRSTLQDASTKNSRLSVPTVDELEAAESQAANTLELCERLEISVLVPSHPHYPDRLSVIKNPPPVLFAKGSTAAISEDAAIAVIGTREPSDYGARLAEKFGAMFAEMSFVVVSGLAIGCDSQAHQGCLRAGGRTVAVMAHGLDMVYPAENRGLAQEIIESSGCLVSEYPPRERPRRNYFVERDRLQSALSAAVVVAETDVKGGTMHTVGFCLEQGKPLACLSHPAKYGDHPKANGNRYLIDKGDATPLSTPADVEAFARTLTLRHPLSDAHAADPDAFDFTDQRPTMPGNTTIIDGSKSVAQNEGLPWEDAVPDGQAEVNGLGEAIKLPGSEAQAATEAIPVSDSPPSPVEETPSTADVAPAHEALLLLPVVESPRATVDTKRTPARTKSHKGSGKKAAADSTSEPAPQMAFNDL